MAAQKLKTLEVRSRGEWRKWLKTHHASEAEIWLVVHKKHTAKQSISYAAAIDEAPWAFFQTLAPPHGRRYLGWIASAKREETQERRVRKAITLLAAGRKLGLK